MPGAWLAEATEKEPPVDAGILGPPTIPRPMFTQGSAVLDFAIYYGALKSVGGLRIISCSPGNLVGTGEGAD